MLAEWTKLWSLRSTYVCLVLTPVIGVGLSSLVALGVGATGPEAFPEGTDLTGQAAALAYVGPVFGVIALVVLAAHLSAGEYPSQIRLTLAAHPRRWRVLAAKTAVLLAVTLAAGFVTAFSAFLASQAVLDAFDMPTAGLTDAERLRTTLLLGATFPLFPLLTLGLGVLLRGSAGAITASLAVMLLPPMFGGLLPADVQRHVLRYLPASAWDNVTGITSPDLPGHMDFWPALGVVAAWIALCLGAALWALHRRDV
ncbi:ABC transporter permease [Thermobifida halotolerans]|uniref:ABC transporter permease n=1 Tax=Thermobifida halotolerans TaxID=483545 RepID=A0AA97M147_9ACTN|nr:ABC transporter permease [Thermobifida halotolerans]